MARLIEFLFFAFIFYMILRRIISPFMAGFRERDEERHRGRWQPPKKEQSKIDRSEVKDAEYRDL